MRHKKWPLKMTLLHIYHKGRRGSRRQGGGLRQIIAAIGQYQVGRINDDEKAGDTGYKIKHIPFAEIQFRDEYEEIQVEKTNEQQV